MVRQWGGTDQCSIIIAPFYDSMTSHLTLSWNIIITQFRFSYINCTFSAKCRVNRNNECSPHIDSRTRKARYITSAPPSDTYSELGPKMKAIDEDATKAQIIEKFQPFMKIVSIGEDLVANQKTVQKLMGDPNQSR